MIDKDGLGRLNENLQNVVEGLFINVEEDSQGKPWRKALLDQRISEFGNDSLSKWIIELEDGSSLNLDYPMEAAHWMTMVIKVRSEAFTDKDKFFGVLITIYPDRRSEVKFDYDPKCLSKMEI